MTTINPRPKLEAHHLEGAKQCPFCASLESSSQYWTVPEGKSTHQEWAVRCDNCGCFGPNAMTPESALDFWNMRRREFPAPYATDKEINNG